MTTERDFRAAAAEPLWQLLDDIDTLDDACKGDDAGFRRAVRAVQQKRAQFAESHDGHTLSWKAPPASKRACWTCQTPDVDVTPDGLLADHNDPRTNDECPGLFTPSGMPSSALPTYVDDRSSIVVDRYANGKGGDRLPIDLVVLRIGPDGAKVRKRYLPETKAYAAGTKPAELDDASSPPAAFYFSSTLEVVGYDDDDHRLQVTVNGREGCMWLRIDSDDTAALPVDDDAGYTAP